MKWTVVILLLGLSTACSRGIKRPDAPEDLVPRDKMINVLTEMVKLEGHVQNRYQQVTKYYKVMVNSGDSLLKAHNLSKEQFESSMDYYAARQDEMTEMYQEVMEKLNSELGELETKK